MILYELISNENINLVQNKRQRIFLRKTKLTNVK